MTKASRELRLLRAALSQQTGEVKLKLVPFTQKDGDKIAVNPDHVALVEQRGATATRIIMRDGNSHEVVEAYAAVVDALSE